jgi:two-component system cell cycle sensor histidine kinase/response regulator CckA
MPGSTSKGGETILLVEDNRQVRELVAETLRADGYQVIAASGGPEALLASERHPGPIHIVLTDIAMPDMTGFSLAERLGRARPELSVLYMSGYAVSSGRRAGGGFLQKPFTIEELAAKVREILDRA